MRSAVLRTGCARFLLRLRRCGPALMIVLLLILTIRPAAAVQLIRDAEIEDILRAYANPVLIAAGLNPDEVHLLIVESDDLNAFVAEGQNIFVHTGLIMKTETPNQLTGVLAHEAGHIAGGHLARLPEALKSASMPVLLSYVLGAAAMLGGAPDAGAALMMGGSHIGQQQILQYTRTQESSADQAALHFLDRAGLSGRGLVEVMEMFGEQELLTAERQDSYVRTHPLSRERVNALENRVSASPHRDATEPAGLQERHDRMRAKLHGYLRPPPMTLRAYPPSDTSIAARYGRAAAYHKAAEREKAIAEVDALLAERPDDPFFWELKGQILFEHGRVEEAIAPYEKAVALAPNQPLLRIGLASAMLATERPELGPPALEQLRQAQRAREDSAFLWRQLAIAYDRSGQEAMAALATAERLARSGAYPDAIAQAERSEAHASTPAQAAATAAVLDGPSGDAIAPPGDSLSTTGRGVFAHLSYYEPMYFAAGHNGDTNARLQLSFKYRLRQTDDLRSKAFTDNLYFAYTQTSVWDLSAASRPFRDTTYSPQLFYYVPDTGWRSPFFTRMGFAAGVAHESNGKGGNDSRSINMPFIRPTWEFGDLTANHLTVSPKIYYYFGTKNNPDIAAYRGYVDLLVKYGSPDGWQLATTLRKGTKHWYSSVDTQFTYPLAKLIGSAWGGYLWIGYFNGYGEYLLDYNNRQHWRARIGYSIAR